MLPRSNYVKPQSAVRARPYKKVEELRTERSVDGIPDMYKLPENRQRLIPSRDSRGDGKENRRPTPSEPITKKYDPIYGPNNNNNNNNNLRNAIDRYYSNNYNINNNNRDRDSLNK